MTNKCYIAITGIGAICPGADCAQQFWRNIVNNREFFTEVPPNRWRSEDYLDTSGEREDTVYSTRGAFLKPTLFNALEFSTPPANIEATDTTQLLALIAAKETLQDSFGESWLNTNLERASVILGATSAQELLVSMASRLQRPMWIQGLRQAGLDDKQINTVCENIANQYVKWQENTFPGVLGNVIAGRIANRFNFGGTNCVTDAACASAFSALSMAVNELLLEKSDLVICGGADTFNDIFMYKCFAQTTALSKSGVCAPFDQNADGTLLGEAICLFALKRLDDAEKCGDKIYAVIRGIGTSSDGKAKSIYAPHSKGQVKALTRCFEEAGYTPQTVSLVEAHGTGTVAGDREELKALHEVYNTNQSQHPWCALGSVKSQIGHTKASAGAAGLLKVVMALRHQILPPTHNIRTPNSLLLELNTPFYLNTTSRPWIQPLSSTPRRAAVSSFGFGGTNFHVTIEEYKENRELQHAKLPFFNHVLICFSAEDQDDLLEQIKAIAKDNSQSLYTLAFNSYSQFNRKQPVLFSAIIDMDKDHEQQWENITECIIKNKPQSNFFINSSSFKVKKIALVFDGQGNESADMGKQLAMHFDIARLAWDAVADLTIKDNQCIQDLVFPIPDYSQNGQQSQINPLRDPAWSLPAITALAESQLNIAKLLGIKPDWLAGQGFGEVIALEAANVIDYRQLFQLSLLAGEHVATKANTPSNDFSQFMKNTAIKMPSKPVVSADGSSELVNNQTLEPLLLSALKNSDQFSKKINALVNNDVNLYVEIGTGNRLTQLIKKTLNDDSCRACSFSNGDETDLTHFLSMLAELLTSGVDINISRLFSDYRQETIPSVTLPSPSVFTIDGGNYNRPFPADNEILQPQTEKMVSKETASFNMNEYHHLLSELVEEKKVTAKESILPEKTNHDHHEVQRPIEKIESEAITQVAKSRESGPATAPKATPASIEIPQTVSIISTPTNQTKEKIAGIDQTLVKIIAEKTGYDCAVIDKKMSFESDLGIDSIKRVEILAEMRKQVPNLPDIDPNQLGSAETIEDIIHLLGNSSDSPAHEATPVEQQPTIEASSEDPLLELLMSCIADKTGFEKEIIQPQMSLEADLGIDSIKRVEILASIRKQYDNLPDADPNVLGGLDTVAEIATYLNREKKK